MERGDTSDQRKRGAKTGAVLLAAITIAGFGLAVAGLTPTALAHSPCDATVSDGESIQAAVDGAEPGHTICVEAGTYDEDVTVSTGEITLEGPNDGVPGDGLRSDEATITGQVVLSADGVTFDGFDVTPPPATENSEGEAVRVSNTPDGVTVQNNVVRDFTEDGLGDWLGVEAIVAFGGDAADPIEDVTITDNAVHGISGNTIRGGAAGVMIQGNVDGATVAGNSVSDVGLEETGWAHGVVVTGTGNHDVAPQNVEISSNELRNIVSSPDDTFATFGVGVGIESSGTGYSILDNTIEDNELGIEVKAAAGETSVTLNAIEGSSKLGASNLDADTLDADSNWWGSPLGPTHESNTYAETGLTGDAVSDGVDYDPWCLVPTCHFVVDTP